MPDFVLHRHGGLCPYQADGTYRGYRWYLRSRHDLTSVHAVLEASDANAAGAPPLSEVGDLMVFPNGYTAEATEVHVRDVLDRMLDGDVRADTRAIDEDIVRLSAAWYDLVSRDHHKDRDCRWMVDVEYAYGRSPVFRAHHAGYVWERWMGPERPTMLEALTDLRSALKEALTSERDWALSVLNDPDWDASDRDVAAEMVAIVNDALGA